MKSGIHIYKEKLSLFVVSILDCVDVTEPVSTERHIVRMTQKQSENERKWFLIFILQISAKVYAGPSSGDHFIRMRHNLKKPV